MWVKKGNIFNRHHAQLPVSDAMEDCIRIYYSSRIDGKSVPLYFDLDKNNPTKVIKNETEPILKWGEKGLFDWSGIMPTKIINHNGLKYLFYIGWSQRLDVPYHNNLGLAISKDNGKNWEKYSKGPIFSTCKDEPGYIGTVEIIKQDNKWLMYYLSCQEWIEHNGIMEPTYDIKLATSYNLIDWTPSKKVIVPLKDDEGGISSVTYRLTDTSHELIFSIRNKINYRENTSDAYRLKKIISTDGINWITNKETVLTTAEKGWDDFMVAYPEYVKIGNKEYLFYNGNGFGATGIGLAEWSK